MNCSTRLPTGSQDLPQGWRGRPQCLLLFHFSPVSGSPPYRASPSASQLPRIPVFQPPRDSRTQTGQIFSGRNGFLCISLPRLFAQQPQQQRQNQRHQQAGG
jgi:hypothetical protein